MLPEAQVRASDPQRLSGTALEAFFNLAERWRLNVKEQRRLLGEPPASTFYKWKATRQARLSRDTLERISYLLGIYKALQTLLPSSQAAETWIRRPNDAPGFNGASALDHMLGGNVADLADVRRYLDAERGW
ncbi:MAG: MbcA/ParS/Xre antitoxin family protein [Nitrococcus sp.]|nr:MbcA/ParS/Xre antitoxin family protein [Nitrococcus sp.]